MKRIGKISARSNSGGFFNSLMPEIKTFMVNLVILLCIYYSRCNVPDMVQVFFPKRDRAETKIMPSAKAAANSSVATAFVTKAPEIP